MHARIHRSSKSLEDSAYTPAPKTTSVSSFGEEVELDTFTSHNLDNTTEKMSDCHSCINMINTSLEGFPMEEEKEETIQTKLNTEQTDLTEQQYTEVNQSDISPQIESEYQENLMLNPIESIPAYHPEDSSNEVVYPATSPFRLTWNRGGDLQTEDKTIHPSFLQRKLTIGRPGDQYEQEADSMAQRVMSMREPLAGLRSIATSDDELGLFRSTNPLLVQRIQEGNHQEANLGTSNLAISLARQKGSGSSLDEQTWISKRIESIPVDCRDTNYTNHSQETVQAKSVREQATQPQLQADDTKVANLKLHADTETVNRSKLTLKELHNAQVGHAWVSLEYINKTKVPSTINDPTKGLLKSIGTSFGFWPLIMRAEHFTTEEQNRVNHGLTPGAGASVNPVHTGFSLNPWKSVPGRVEEPDTAHSPKGTKEYRLTQGDVASLLAYVNSKRNANYNLYSFNCTTFAVQAVRSANQEAPSGSMFGICLPNGLYEDLYKMHKKGDKSVIVAPLDGGERNE